MLPYVCFCAHTNRKVGDIRDLGAQCVREQVNLQDILRHHIAAQIKLQAEIHEHLTSSAAPPPSPAPTTSPIEDEGKGNNGKKQNNNDVNNDTTVGLESTEDEGGDDV